MTLSGAVLVLALVPLRAPEGPLNNDVFVPVSKQATEALARGDEAYRDAAGDELALTAAFEAWRSALTASATGELVSLGPDAGPDAGRRTVGVEAAVLERLERLPLPERLRWSERFGELAALERDAAGRAPDALAGVERRNPGTLAAVAACLALADRELESGHAPFARLWCARGRRHAELVGTPADALRDALARRAQAAREVAREEDEFDRAWTEATRLRFIGRLELTPRTEAARGRHRSSRTPPAAPSGLTPGLAFLGDGRLAAQVHQRVVLVDPTGRELETSFEPAELLPVGARVPAAHPLPGDPRHWPLTPTPCGEDLLLIHGRATPGTPEPNALLCVAPPSPPPAYGVSSAGLPALRWARVGDQLVNADEELVADPLFAGFEVAEFQPGPLVLGARVFVQVRRYEGDVRAFLACLDAETGRTVWVRRLAQGSGLRGASERTGLPPRASVPGQPLAYADGSILVGTQLGAAVLASALDGRLEWSFENRRREPGVDGWRTNFAPPVAPTGRDEGALAVWAPQDSDHLYWLRLDARGAEISPLDGTPVPIGDALALAGAGRAEAVLLAGDGSRRLVTSWDRRSGARAASPYLGREETFTGTCAVSADRFAFASDRGLYLLDRERELFLLDYKALPSGVGGGSLGGGVWARGARLFVLGEDALWTYLGFPE